jgi:hypothetical protein
VTTWSTINSHRPVGKYFFEKSEEIKWFI